LAIIQNKKTTNVHSVQPDCLQSCVCR